MSKKYFKTRQIDKNSVAMIWFTDENFQANNFNTLVSCPQGA